MTANGLSWIDPERLYRNMLPPPVIIRSFTANGRVYPAPANLGLARGTSKLRCRSRETVSSWSLSMTGGRLIR